jgi:hypothetical protein
LLLHILENTDNAPFIQVDDGTVGRAAALVRDFLIPHGRAFYQDTLSLGRAESLQTVASYVLTSDQDRFSVSDLRYNVRSLRDVKTPWEMNALLAPFVSGGWLVEDNKAWLIAANIRGQFADRRALEISRKAEVMERFKPRGGAA